MTEKNSNKIKNHKNTNAIGNIPNLDAPNFKESRRVIWAIIHWQGKQIGYLGVCSYSWKPSFDGNASLTLVFHDLYVDVLKGSCEEEKRCLNVSCLFNKTTFESYAAAKKLSPTQKKLFETEWIEFLEIIASYAPIAEICKKAYEKNPNVTAIHIYLKAKSSRIFKPDWNLSKKLSKGD
jgi:hypothetical protein